MAGRLGALATVAVRMLGWGVVLFVVYLLWDLAADYLVSICGERSSFGGGCSAPGLDHYYRLLTDVSIAAAVLVPMAVWNLAALLREGGRKARARGSTTAADGQR